jgi:hypothetical protein
MINNYIKTNVDGLVKDPKSGAILNVDNNKLLAYKKQKELFNKTNKMENRLTKLETDMSEIKNMLKQLLAR